MVSIPGYQYDPDTNRYYKIETTPMLKRTEVPCEQATEPNRKSKRIRTFLNQYSMSVNPVRGTQLVCRLIDTSPTSELKCYPTTDSTKRGSLIYGSFRHGGPYFLSPTRRHHGVYTFPEGECAAEHYTNGELPRWFWDSRHRTYVIADPKRELHNGPSCDIRILRRQGEYAIHLHTTFNLHPKFLGSIAVDPQLHHVCVAQTNKVFLHTLGANPSIWTCQPLPMPHLRYIDTAEVQVLRMMEGSVFAGSRSGRVYRWDTRAPAVGSYTSFTPSGNSHSISDISISHIRPYEVYVSSMRDGKNNLAVWDQRKFTNNEPIRTFRGHFNSHKPILFDLDENAGCELIVSPGIDGVVRLWDCCQGGEPISTIQIGHNVIYSQLVGWENTNRSGKCGLIMVTSQGRVMTKMCHRN